jgi:ribonuclease Z
VENQVKAGAWGIEGRKGSFPDNGGRAEVQEFDYKKIQLICDKNGVKVTQFPAIHALDGSVSFRMDWGKRSFVFGGDSAPNNWYIKHAKGAEIAVQECASTRRKGLSRPWTSACRTSRATCTRRQLTCSARPRVTLLLSWNRTQPWHTTLEHP